MNERIKELVKQAGGHFTTRNLMSNPVQHLESIELWDKNIEKFAELIVRECAAIAGKAEYSSTWTEPVEDTIKKHFGIK